MPKYTITITRLAQKQLDALNEKAAAPIIQHILDLADEPRPHGCKKLKGRSGYRIRSGDYRIIYEIFDTTLIIDVVALGHRKDIYD